MSAGGTVAVVDGEAFPLSLIGSEELSPALIERVEDVCAQAEDATGTPMVVVGLDGGGGAAAWPGDVGVHVVSKWERALRRLESLGAVIVSVASGTCQGPLLETLLATDYRIATPDAVFAFPQCAGDAWPGMATHRLANQVGVARARQLVLFGARLTAAEALAVGLIDAVTEQPQRRVEDLHRSSTTTGPEFAIRRRLLLDAPAVSFEEALGAHLAACDRSLLRARGIETTAEDRGAAGPA